MFQAPALAPPCKTSDSLLNNETNHRYDVRKAGIYTQLLKRLISEDTIGRPGCGVGTCIQAVCKGIYNTTDDLNGLRAFDFGASAITPCIMISSNSLSIVKAPRAIE